MALEENKELFSALLAPMVRSLTTSSSPQPQVFQRSQDHDAMKIVPAKIKQRCINK
jgi:hypothetical protein